MILCRLKTNILKTTLLFSIFAAKFKQRNASSFEIVLSRNDLASLVGTATETLIRMLQTFKKERYY